MHKVSGKCPGQNPAFLKNFNTNIVPCPRCGHEVEFFADEKKVKCPGCKSSVFKVDAGAISYENGKINIKDNAASCLDWCGGCLDARDYKDIIENNERIKKKNEDFTSFINTIDKRDIDVINFFVDAFKKSINHPKLIDQKIFDILAKENPELFLKARNYYMNYFNS